MLAVIIGIGRGSRSVCTDKEDMGVLSVWVASVDLTIRGSGSVCVEHVEVYSDA